MRHPDATRADRVAAAADDLSLSGTDARLLIVVRGAETYGTSTQILGTIESLAARRAAVQIYAIGEGALADAVRANSAFPVFVDPATPPRFEAVRTSRLVGFSRTLRASVPFVRHLAGHIRRHPCDAIIFCEHGLAMPIGLVAKLTGTSAFWLMANGVTSGYPLDLNRRIYTMLFRNFSVVPVANSEFTRRTLGRGARYAAKIDLGINPERIAPHVESNAALSPADPDADARRIQLLVMSRLVPGKGHLVLLRALLSRPAFQDIDLTICGGPLGTPYADQLLREAASHGASARLHLAGPTADIAPFYRAADVVANCRLDPEPFGMSVVEAMLAGKPVLAHAAGGPADIVVDGVTGWHVAAPTPEAFAEGLQRMLRDRPRWPAMGQAGMQRAWRKYTHHAMTSQLLNVVSEKLHLP